jgi:hypothetical protein
MDYPNNLPCPQIDGYSYDIDYGVTQVAFENGRARQRKMAATPKYIFNLSLVLSMRQVWEWQSWANLYGYDWHYMNLMSDQAGLREQTMIAHFIRYISDISFEPVDIGYMRATFQAEMDSNTLPKGIVERTGDWLLGGSVASPSADLIVAGSPSSPSYEVIAAGSPGQPAA